MKIQELFNGVQNSFAGAKPEGNSKNIIYFLVENDEIVYIGVTLRGRSKTRIAQHLTDKKPSSVFSIPAFDDRVKSENLEMALINICKPKLNKDIRESEQLIINHATHRIDLMVNTKFVSLIELNINKLSSTRKEVDLIHSLKERNKASFLMLSSVGAFYCFLLIFNRVDPFLPLMDKFSIIVWALSTCLLFIVSVFLFAFSTKIVTKYSLIQQYNNDIDFKTNRLIALKSRL